MTDFEATSAVCVVMDNLTTLNRRFTRVSGYRPIDKHEYRMGLKNACDALVQINCQLLVRKVDDDGQD